MITKEKVLNLIEENIKTRDSLDMVKDYDKYMYFTGKINAYNTILSYLKLDKP